MRTRFPLLLQSLKMAQPPNLLNVNGDHTSNSFPVSSPSKSKPPKAKRISISILVMSLPVLYVSLLHVPPNTLFHDTTFWFLISNTIIIIIANDSGVFAPSGDTNDLYDEFIKHSKARSACVVTEPPVMADGKENSDASERGEDPQTVVDHKDSSDNQGLAEEPLVITDGTESLDEPEHEQKPQAMASGEDSLHDARYVHEPLALVDVKESLDDGRHAQEPPAVVGGAARSAYWKRSRSRSELAVRNGLVENEKPRRRSVTENKGMEVIEYSSLSDEELNRRVEEFIRRFKEIRLKEMGRERLCTSPVDLL